MSFIINQTMTEVEILKDFQEISNKIQSLMTTMRELSAKANHFTAYSGDTGCGKSTLTNYIHNVKLDFAKKPGGKYQIIRSLNPEEVPIIQIGNKKSSCTIIPNVCNFNGSSSADLVGWNDTQSSKQQIVNGYANSVVLTKGKNVRFVLVCQISALNSAKGSSFVQLSNRLSEVFKYDFKSMVDSITIVFSKVKMQDWDLNIIKDEIIQILKYNQSIKIQTRNMLNNVLSKNRICIFPTPDTENFSEYIKIIKTTVASTKETALTNNTNISLSKAAICLRKRFQQILTKNSQDLKEQYSKVIQKDFLTIKYQNSTSLAPQINNLKNILNAASQMRNATKNQQQQIKLIEKFSISSKVSQKIKDSSSKHLKMLQFCKIINLQFNGYLNFAQLLQKTCHDSLTKLEANQKEIYNQQQKLIKEEKQKQQKIRIQAQLKKKRQQQLKKAQQEQKRKKQQAAKKLKQEQQKQRILLEQKQAQRKRKQKQLEQAIKKPPPPPQIIYHYDGGCRII